METTSNNSVPNTPQSSKTAETPPPPAESKPLTKPVEPTPDPMDKYTTPTDSKPPQKSLPFPLIMVLLIVSFLIGLILATLYFQNQLKELTNQTVSNETNTRAKQQTITVGTDATFEPMEFVSGKNVIGYDVDLAQQLGNELGEKVVIKNIPWDTLFTALDKKEIDMIISSVTITDDRKKNYEFSNPYLQAGQVFITSKAPSASGSANMKGAKIGVQEGTTSETVAKQYTTADKVIKFPDVVQATAALKANQVDGILSDLTSAKGIVKTNPDLQISGDLLTNESYGIVLRKGDTRKNQINTALESLRVKGIIADLKQKWLD